MAKKPVALRLDEELLSRIDARAEDSGLSRNEWFIRCTTWVLDSVPKGLSGKDLSEAVDAAPSELRGTS